MQLTKLVNFHKDKVKMIFMQAMIIYFHAII